MQSSFARREQDARRVMEVLPKRLSRYALTLHPDKTRTVPFKRQYPESSGRGNGQGPRPGTFDFLGFTLYWGLTRRRKWAVKKKTAKSRKRWALKQFSVWCRRNRHLPLVLQWATLRRKLRGHYAYYGITGNYAALGAVYHRVVEIWRYWLNRRAQRRNLSWPRFRRIQARYPLPRPQVVHSIYRSQRTRAPRSRMR